VGHAGNKIDEGWQQIPRRGVVGSGRNLAGSYRGGLVYPAARPVTFGLAGPPREPKC